MHTSVTIYVWKVVGEVQSEKEKGADLKMVGIGKSVKVALHM